VTWRGSFDPLLFARDCGIDLDFWQQELLRDRPRKARLCRSRQSGKTTTTAAVAIETTCHVPNSLVLIGAPAQRQLGEMLRKVRDCRSRLDGAPDLARRQRSETGIGNSSSTGAYFFGALDLTETQRRIATLRIRSGVRFIVFAISSSVLEALASSVTRRSCLNDQPLGISVQFVLKTKPHQKKFDYDYS